MIDAKMVYSSNLCFHVNKMTLDEDWNAIFKLLHALTNMVPMTVTYKIGLGDMATKVVKHCLAAKEALMVQILDSLAYMPKLMKGAQLDSSFDTLVFSLDSNMKSAGRR